MTCPRPARAASVPRMREGGNGAGAGTRTSDMEPTGIEPVTSALPARRSPS